MSYTNAKATRVMATHCIFCGKELVDAESVERGIGPVCNKKYGCASVNPGPTEVAKAIGILVPKQTLLAQEDPTFFERLLERHPDGHKIGNLLIYEASAFLNNKNFVIVLSNALRQLGYDVAANKIQGDRCIARIVQDGSIYEVHTPFNSDLNRDLHRVNGIAVARDGKRFKHRTIPTTSLHELLVVLGRHYPGEDLFIEGVGTTTIQPSTQDQFEALAESVRLVETDEKIEIYTPGFNRDFTDDIKKIRGKVPVRDQATNRFKCWEVPANQKQQVIGLINRHFNNPRISVEYKGLDLDEGLEFIN